MAAHRLPVKFVIEAKVWAATGAAFLASVVVSVLNAVEADHSLLGPVPGAVQTVVLVLGPTVATFLGGYATRHTPRPSDGP